MRPRIAFYRDQAIDGLAEAIQHPRMGALRWCVRRRPLVWVVPRRIAAGGAVIATTGAVMAAMVPAASADTVAAEGARTFHARAGAPAPGAPGDEAPHDKLPPFAKSQEKDETSTKRKLFIWDNETKQSKLVEERTDGSIRETTGENSDNGVGGEADGGGGKARRGGTKAGPEGTLEGRHVGKSGSAETLQFKDKEQYDAYRARLREAYKVAGREVDLGASDGSSQPGWQKKLDEETAKIREEMRIPRTTTESSGERREGSVSGQAWVVGGKYGANGEVLTEVTVNDNGTPDPGDDIRTETTKTSGSDVNLEIGAGFEVDGAGGASSTYKYVQNGSRAGSLVYENGKLAKFVQVKEQDWESGTEASGGPKAGEKDRRSGAGTAKTDTGTFDSGVTVIRTEVDLNQPGAKEALEAWRNAQTAYEEAGKAGDRTRLTEAEAALREAERNWGGYLEKGTRVRAEYSRDAGSTSLGLDGCFRLVCGGFGLTQGNDNRQLLGTFYKDPGTGQWRPYSFHNPGDLDGDGVDDTLTPNNVGPGSGNPNNDSSGGEADDPVIPAPGDPFPDFPERLGLEGDPNDARDVPGSWKQDLPPADQRPSLQDEAPERQDQRNSDEDSGDERSRPADRDDDSGDESRENDADDESDDDADDSDDDSDSDSDSDDGESDDDADEDADEDQSDDDSDDQSDEESREDDSDDSDDDESDGDQSDDDSDDDESDGDQSDDESNDDDSDSDESDGDESDGDESDGDESDEDSGDESSDDESDGDRSDDESNDDDSDGDESDGDESDEDSGDESSDDESDDHDSDHEDSGDDDSDDHESDDHDSDEHESDDHDSDGGSGDDGSDDSGGDDGSGGGGDSDDGGDSGGGESSDGGGQAAPDPAPEPAPAPAPPPAPEPAPAPEPRRGPEVA